MRAMLKELSGGRIGLRSLHNFCSLLMRKFPGAYWVNMGIQFFSSSCFCISSELASTWCRLRVDFVHWSWFWPGSQVVSATLCSVAGILQFQLYSYLPTSWKSFFPSWSLPQPAQLIVCDISLVCEGRIVTGKSRNILYLGHNGYGKTLFLLSHTSAWAVC